MLVLVVVKLVIELFDEVLDLLVTLIVDAEEDVTVVELEVLMVREVLVVAV